MNKKQLKRENILRHGLNLCRVFRLDRSSGLGPIVLYETLHRIEARAHTLNEKECNGEPTPEGWEERVLKKLNDLLDYKDIGLRVLINGDPRGYALKIDDQQSKKLNIYRDMGGYGILAPDF